MRKTIHRVLPLLLLFALLLGMLPNGSAVEANAAETDTTAPEATETVPVSAEETEPTFNPLAEAETPTEPEPSAAAEAEPTADVEPEPAEETEAPEQPVPSNGEASAEPVKAEEPAQEQGLALGVPTGTVTELEAIPVPDDVLADSYRLQIPVILYGTSSFSVSFKYPNDPKQTTYSVSLTGFRYHYLNGQMAYCLEPQAGSTAGAIYSQIAGGANLNVWDQFLSDSQRGAISLALAYGAPNTLTSSTRLMLHGYEAATQVIIWEIIIGYRSPIKPYTRSNAGLYNFVLGLCNPNDSTGALRAAYIEGYNAICASMADHEKIPSFSSKKLSQARTYDMTYDASTGLYKVVLTDTNNAINSDFPYQNGNGLTFTKSGNKLTVTATSAALNNAPVTVTTKGKVLDTENASPVIWGTSNSNHEAGQILSQMAKPDPVPCYFKLQPGTTSLEIVKRSDDGNVGNITFTVKSSAGTTLFTGKTDANGKLTVSNLNVGDTVTVTETVPADYVADNRTQTITLTAGANTLTFVNHPVARLEIIKESTDGNVAGITFTVKDSAGAVLYTGATDANGKLNVEGLTVGQTITVTESVPAHYVAENRTQTIALVKGLNTLSFRNYPTGDGILQKTAEDGDVEGYFFRLYRHKDSASGISSKTWCGRSDAEGRIYLTDGEFNEPNGQRVYTFTDLTDGKYSLRELLSMYGAGDVQVESIAIQTSGGVTEACNLVFTGDSLHVDDNGDAYVSAVPLTGLTGGGHLTITIHNKPVLTPGSITVKKVDQQKQPLAGAVFLLEYSTDNGTTWAPAFSRDAESEPVPGGCSSEGLTDGTLTTGADGLVAFTGLFTDRRNISVRFRLTEIKTTPGYSLLAEPVYEGTLSKDAELDLSFTVVNAPDYEMPMTGGTGFRVAALAAALAVLSGTVFWITRRRKIHR